MGKVLTVEEANKLLEEARKTNPGKWIEHSKYVGFIARKIAHALGLDEDKLEAFGLVHDIGRQVGPCNLRHVYEGYDFLMNLGYEEAARICMTHSFYRNSIEGVIGKLDLEQEKIDIIDEYIKNVEFNIYDKVIQLSDCLALSTGITTIERRMTDVFFRYGFDEYTEFNMKARLELQKEVEDKLGYSIYNLFKDELIESLLSKKVDEDINFIKK